MPVPLLALDPSKLQRLRGGSHTELKNELMMTYLMSLAWFRAYREALTEYRKRGGSPPPYPTEQVERVERAVDDYLRKHVDPNYTR